MAMPKDSNPKYTKRKCLKCEKLFPSTGPGNRICLQCAQSNSRAIDSTKMTVKDPNYKPVPRKY